jgi:hypothetical protein
MISPGLSWRLAIIGQKIIGLGAGLSGRFQGESRS